MVADAGYESEENYVYLQENDYTSYIKPQNHEQRKTKKEKSRIDKPENMTYDSENDTYTCAAGKVLRPIGKSKRTSRSGYVSELTRYECESCDGCPVKEKCTKSKGNRQMELSHTFMALRDTSEANISTPTGILLRMNRSIQAEGVFGAIKEDHGFRRFLLRGKKNVRIEFLLMSLGHNMNKLHNKIQSNRCGEMLHNKAIA